MDDKPATNETFAPAPKHFLLWLMAGLAAWGLYLAVGATFPAQGVPEARQESEGSREILKDGSMENDASVSKSVGQENPRSMPPNYLRGVVVIVCFAIFLGWYGGLQWLYARRQQRK